MKNANAKDLSVDDQISLYIGRAARGAVELELVLQRAYKELVRMPYDRPGPTGVDTLVKRCVAALPDSDLRPELEPIATKALDFASQANLRRNRLVHDLWRQGSNEHEYQAIKFDEGDAAPRLPLLELAEFSESVDDIVTAQLRVGAIYWLLLDSTHSGSFPLGPHYERLLEGRFRIGPNGDAIMD